MTQPPDQQPTGLPPEQEAVRRLLADARHDGPTPPEVVARLDATLASLAAERESAPTTSTTTAPVIDLGARRRRMAGVGLLAAAAVVVAGVALGPGLPSMQGGSDAGSSAAGDTATSQRELSEDSAGGADSGSGGAESQEMQPKSQLSPGLLGYPELFTFDDDLDDELVRLRDAPPAAPESSESTRAGACDVPSVGRGRQVVAEVDGTLGLVVFRRADGASQQVDLYVCGDPTAVRTLTLPAP